MAIAIMLPRRALLAGVRRRCTSFGSIAQTQGRRSPSARYASAATVSSKRVISTAIFPAVPTPPRPLASHVRCYHGAEGGPAKKKTSRRPGRSSSGGGVRDPAKDSGAFVWNQLIVELGKRNDWKGILGVFEVEGDKFNHVNWATAMSQLGRIRGVDREDASFVTLVDALADVVVERGLEFMGIRQMVNIVYALAKMQLRTKSAQRIIEFVTEEENAKVIVKKGVPQDVSNTCWALATLNRSDRSHAFLSEVEKRAEWFVQEGKPQHVSNTAWAFASLGHGAPNLFGQIERRAKWLVREGRPQAVANTAWALATLGHQPTNLFGQIEKRAERLVEEGAPQEISNTAWALATLGHQAPRLFGGIERQAEYFVQEGRPQAVANIAWAFATLRHPAPNLFHQIERRAERLVREGKPQEVANMLWAASKLQYNCPELLANANQDGARLVEEGNAQVIANSALAFATLDCPTDDFYTALANNLPRFIKEGNSQALCNTCYALSILDDGNVNQEVLGKVWDVLMEREPSSFSLEELRQLAQVYSFCDADGVILTKPSQELTALICSAPVHGPPSPFQDDVSSVLDRIGFDHEEDVGPLQNTLLDVPGMLAIDIACPDHMIAIECDGPYHFLRDTITNGVTRIENGATRAKRRFLERKGWKVINIHYLDWIEVTKSGKEENFLRDKLAVVGVR